MYFRVLKHTNTHSKPVVTITQPKPMVAMTEPKLGSTVTEHKPTATGKDRSQIRGQSGPPATPPSFDRMSVSSFQTKPAPVTLITAPARPGSTVLPSINVPKYTRAIKNKKLILEDAVPIAMPEVHKTPTTPPALPPQIS